MKRQLSVTVVNMM